MRTCVDMWWEGSRPYDKEGYMLGRICGSLELRIMIRSMVYASVAHKLSLHILCVMAKRYCVRFAR